MYSGPVPVGMWLCERTTLRCGLCPCELGNSKVKIQMVFFVTSKFFYRLDYKAFSIKFTTRKTVSYSAIISYCLNNYFAIGSSPEEVFFAQWPIEG